MNKALIIIDYTNDFVGAEGVLTCGVPAQQIEQHIINLYEDFLKDNQYIVVANDKHDVADNSHPEYVLFPPHNIVDTTGRELYGALRGLVAKQKGNNQVYLMDKRRYSAFAGTDLDVRLREKNITEIHLCGVCTDICVLHTAISGYNLGYKIVVHENAVASFNDVGHIYALTHLKSVLGATVI